MFCGKCGKELPAGVRFCPACGAPVETEPPVTEPPVTEGPMTEPPAVAVAEPETAPAKKKSGGKKTVLICVAAVALAVALGVLLYLFQRFSGGEDPAPAYAYLTGEGELMLLPDLKEKTQALELTDAGVAWVWTDSVQFSRDGKSVYFLGGTDNGDADLYHAAASQLKKGGRAERVARNVSTFQPLGDKGAVYWAYDEDYGSALGLFDGVDSDILCKNCMDYALGEDGQSLYYLAGDGDLCRVDLSDGAEELLLEDVDAVLTSYEAQTLVYTVDENSADEDGNYYTVYAGGPGREPEKLAEGVCGYFTGAWVENGQVRLDYTTQTLRETTLYDFVNDPGDGALDALTEPDYDDHAVQEVEYLPESGAWRYITRADAARADADQRWRNVDVSPLLTEGTLPENLTSGEVWNLVNGQLEAEYEEKLTAWNAAIRRDQLRQTLKDQDYTAVSYDLYRQVDGVSQLIAADVLNLYGQDGIYLYQKASGQDKVAALDELDFESYYETIESALRPGQWYQNVNGVERPIDLGGAVDLGEVYLLDGGEVAVTVYREDYTPCLLSFTVQGNELKDGGTLAEDMSYPQLARPAQGGGPALYFVTDMTDSALGTVGTLVRYQNAAAATLAENVSNAWLAPDGQSVYAAVLGQGDAAGLVLLRDGARLTITDDLAVYTDAMPFAPCGEELIYIGENDRLYAWDGEDARRLAKNVKAVWANGVTGYTQLW